ncbi:hypothetical protein [Niveispirillum sp. KHB5.9]|uniref:hypothetical protein n=1 Tax=Niveispirillum sp. KHB5.9 TaxID=3400269 RepID=UPI003A8B12F7
MSIDNLVDILKRRNITSIGYFHADHFEPWSKGTGGEYCAGVEKFQAQSAKSRFGRKMSLFYQGFVPAAFVQEGDSRALPGDRVGFGSMPEADRLRVNEVMHPMERDFGHEMHLHIHHERWTRNTGGYDKKLSSWIDQYSTPEMDSRRLDRFIGLSLNSLSSEIARPVHHWAFVHGNWALNGSDHSICMVEDEIDILMRHGCWGDFTFPAGRGHCDPTILDQPYTCLPAHGMKVYDLPQSQPQPVRRGQATPGSGRFLIWASPIKAAFSSLDYYSEGNRMRFRAPERMIEAWLEGSVVIDGRLFIKTHAHSLKWEYEIPQTDAPIPHCHPDVVGIFDLLERVAEQARLPIEMMSVNEVRRWLSSGAEQPQAIVAPQPVTIVAPVVEDGVQPGTVEWVDRFDADFGRALEVWLEGSEKRQDAAGAFYTKRLEARELVSAYERAVIDFVRANFPPETTRLFEIGTGFGTLSTTLAALGYEVVGYEGASLRADGAEAVALALAPRYPTALSHLRIVRGFFPDAASLTSLTADKKNVLIATNIVNSFSADNQDRILRFALNFDEFLFDTTRFGISRGKDEIGQALESGLAAAFEDLGPVWSHNSGAIRHLRSRSILSSEDVETTSPVPADTAGRGEIGPLLDDVKIAARQFLSPLVTEGALDELYQFKLSRDRYVEPYEESVIADILARHAPQSTHIVEIGTGLGGLSLVLAALGYKVTSFEIARRRASQSQMMVDHWRAEHPDPALDITIINQPFPSGLPASTLDAGRTNVLVSTNIVNSYTAASLEALLRAAMSFDEYILDIGRIGTNRNSPEERNAFLSALTRFAFAPQAVIYRQGANEYWRLTVKSIINVT